MLSYRRRTVLGQTNQTPLMSINSCGRPCCPRFRSRRTTALLAVEIVAAMLMLLPATSSIVSATELRHRVAAVGDLLRLNKLSMRGTPSGVLPSRRNQIGRLLFNQATSSFGYLPLYYTLYVASRSHKLKGWLQLQLELQLNARQAKKYFLNNFLLVFCIVCKSIKYHKRHQFWLAWLTVNES